MASRPKVLSAAIQASGMHLYLQLIDLTSEKGDLLVLPAFSLPLTISIYVVFAVAGA
jgi:hypothetical protein